MSTWLRRVWHLLNRPRRERELVEEMNAHRASMHDPTTFGDTHRLLERSRDAWGWNWLDDAMQDLTVGVRSLMRSPSFTITASLILTFGIGLNVALYQLVSVAMLRPPTIKAVESWARFVDAEPRGTSTTVPYPLTQFAKTNGTVLAAVLVESQASVAWGTTAAEQVDASFVSPNWFDELGMGRCMAACSRRQSTHTAIFHRSSSVTPSGRTALAPIHMSLVPSRTSIANR
jgi:hypothetical protein